MTHQRYEHYETRGEKGGHPFRGNQFGRAAGGVDQGDRGKAQGIADHYGEQAAKASRAGDHDKAARFTGAEEGARHVSRSGSRVVAAKVVVDAERQNKRASQPDHHDQGYEEGAKKAYTARYGGSHKDVFTQTVGGGAVSRTDAARIMFGTGSKQHKAAQKRFGA